ncbi:MAG: S-layer homology domain-containing protein, partial [Clostridia bacterium]|nr:S-layer homology domain-containing protein [Clostridia bacterium]
VNTAKSVGVTERTKEYFYQNKITREEFCDLIYNTIKVVLKKTYTINTSFKFEDTDNEAVLILSKLGIVNGKTATEFAPNDFLTREEAATIIVRMINSLMPFPVTKMWFEYDDISDISQWASDSVQAISNLGFMNGVGDNKFAPKDTYTTQQAIATLVRVYECAKENGIINEVSIIGGADKPTQILVTDTVKVDEFYIDEALKLTREAGELAADSEFISYYTPDEKIKERISAIGAENWSKPQEIYYISANRDKIVAFAEALLGKDAKNIDIDKFTELHKLNYIQLAAMINASYGTENLAALTILANSEGYIMPKDFEKSFALYLQYDGQYSALVSFSKYGEGVISANMSFVKNGDKDNVFSRIYEITQGLGEESVAVAKVKGE